MNYIEILVLSTVQGIGEFLPISSSSNITLISKLLSFNDLSLSLKIALHGGSLLALLIYFRQIIWKIILGLFTNKIKLSNTAFNLMVFSTIPVIIAGAIFSNFLHSFDIPVIIGITLIAFGIILHVTDKYNIRINCKSNILQYIIIGLFQSLAIFPGVSRSGICITACRILNIDRARAIKTSLLLAIPSISGSLVLELINMYKYNTLNTIDIKTLFAVLLTGIIGIIFIEPCIKYMEKNGFYVIMWYRIIIGLIFICLI
ncbi:MAG: undecaprenyl-diphosphate phosphatase [Alphaproteobacteria bacterium]|nr:undecaprenyl-diphosphate phosphatase [Alphaproteobacteria bacterium]